MRQPKKAIDAALALTQPVGGGRRRELAVSPGRPTAVVIPATFGSVGDQMLLLGTRAALGAHAPDVFVPGDPGLWARAGIDGLQALGALARGRTFHMTRAGRERYARSDLVVIGADTVTGDYGHAFLAHRVRALNTAAASGHRAQLVNFSFHAEPTPLSIRLLRALEPDVELWARDRLSQERAAHALGRAVEVAPDVGALMVAERTAAVRATVAEVRRDGIALLVPNAHFATHFGVRLDDLVDFWVALARMLAADGLGIVVMPHDTRLPPDDPGLAHRIVTALGGVATEFVPRSPQEAKGMASLATLCVSARMHACVGALSSGVPTVGLEYVGKFAGQLAWYGRAGRVVDFVEALDLTATARAIAAVRRHDPDERARIDVGDIGLARTRTAPPD